MQSACPHGYVRASVRARVRFLHLCFLNTLMYFNETRSQLLITRSVTMVTSQGHGGHRPTSESRSDDDRNLVNSYHSRDLNQNIFLAVGPQQGCRNGF